MVDIEERISVLLKQEITSYRTEDYVATGYQQKLPFFRLQNQESLSSTQGEGISNNGIKRLWREKICQWCYEVIDHFDISREIVSIAVNYLDRFLSLQSVDRTGFQLLAMSCLHLAIKLYEPSVVTMKTMIELSRGTFLEEHMVKMEVALLRVLSWKVHPPTANCFTKHILLLIPDSMIALDTRCDIFELAKFLIEMSVMDYFFVAHRPSTVATAALLNAMTTIGVPDDTIVDFAQELLRFRDLDPAQDEVKVCQSRLLALYVQGAYDFPTSVTATDDRTDTISPVSVAKTIVSSKDSSMKACPELKKGSQHFVKQLNATAQHTRTNVSCMQ